ncbi:hypothetical protein KAK05_00455 [Candidatus Parcubacteria bacterium]|nr:hypothetical protein [Candidatus Parcubacteria bacterium]
MQEILNSPIKKKICILSLGAESVGRFCFYDNGKIYISENFGDILDVKNLKKFEKAVLKQVKCKKPDMVLTDLHPLYNSTIFGEELAKKLKIPQTKVQHHIAHIFSAVGDKLCHPEPIEGFAKIESARDSSTPLRSAQNDNAYNILNTEYSILNTFYGIASDGTGFGFDRNIWGGEVFQVKNEKRKTKSTSLVINRVSSLEEQTMIGGDLAVKEPARILISILSKFLPKEKVYENVKKFYTKNEFELLYNQLQQNFNCQTTTSTGRILDAVSVLLGFAKNGRKSKHEATKLLEESSTLPYKDYELRIMNYESRKIIGTTYLFEYLLKNIKRDKKRLAATAQEYIARGFWEIIKVETRQYLVPTKETQLPAKYQISNIPASKFKDILNTKYCIPNTYFAGGMANNKIISSYLENKDVYTSKKIPRGDEGIAFGQIVFYILN